MTILAVDSSIGTSVGVIDEAGETLSEIISVDPLAHVELVGDAIERALQMANLQPSDLSAVAVGVGPGPFTGLRVGIAAASGFAFGAAKPLFRVSSLDALALQLYQHDISGFRKVRSQEFTVARGKQAQLGIAQVVARPGLNESVHLVTDARRREVFSAVYEGIDADGLPISSSHPHLLAGADVLDTAITADWVSATSVAILAQTRMRLELSAEQEAAIYLRAPDVTLSVPKRVS